MFFFPKAAGLRILGEDRAEEGGRRGQPGGVFLVGDAFYGYMTEYFVNSRVCRERACLYYITSHS